MRRAAPRGECLFCVLLCVCLLPAGCTMPVRKPKPSTIVAPKVFRDYAYSFSDDHEDVLRLLATRRADGLTDDELLEAVSRAAFQYFWDEAHPETGFVYDSLSNRSSSSAATGFGLASICVADYRGWITHEQARERVLKILRSILENPGWESLHGLFYHWVDPATGRWTGVEGMCLHDHMALICGVLTVREYFKGTEIEALADRIAGMSDWPFLMHRGRGTLSDRSGHLSNVSTPDSEDWGGVVEYDGMKLDYLLPIGAKNAVDAWYWDNWARSYVWGDYNGRYHRITRAALWIHQWDNCYLDLFCMRDAYADYFQNSVENTLANRQWCMDNGMYNAELWGLNPTDGPTPSGDGSLYGNHGAPPPPPSSWEQGHTQDGTIAFAGALPSIIFTPEACLLVLRHLWDNHKDKMWGKYGFTMSLNPRRNWYSRNYIGIDLGPVILNIENYRSGLIWKYFMRCPEIGRGLQKSGFVGVVDNFDPMEHSLPYADWNAAGGRIAIEEDALEGARCLSVTFDVSTPTRRLEARPLRRNFSFHSLLGVYVAGAGAEIPFRVVIEDGAGRTAALIPARTKAVFQTGRWQFFAWQCDTVADLDRSDIRKVVFEPITAPSGKAILLDNIILYDEDEPGTARPHRTL